MLSDTASPDQWRTFVQRCLAHRVDVDEFKDLSKLMQNRSPLKENDLLDLLLEARAASSIAWDPLLPVYVDGLCKVGQVKAASALRRLLAHSSIRQKSHSKPNMSTLMTDIKVIQDVMLSISTGAIPRRIAEAAELYDATVDWIVAFVEWHNHGLSQQTGGLMSSPDAVSLFESLGILLAALSGTSKGLETLSSDHHQGMQPPFRSQIKVRSPGAENSYRTENEAGPGSHLIPAFVCRRVPAPAAQAGHATEGVQSVWTASLQAVGPSDYRGYEREFPPV
jgi:mediator of RNA polymerase II transcription subunit 5